MESKGPLVFFVAHVQAILESKYHYPSSHTAVPYFLLSKAVAGDRVSHAAMRNMMVPWLPGLSSNDDSFCNKILLANVHMCIQRMYCIYTVYK